ncbi:GNAT family N-acetyltransferase [Gryllotalpicola kribbensis]|jgi:GNAT superfamily N-acetyltransferase|uniref:GNAT family N-acetyltransferase n=1 Tax=Gryllotalpicola kribbensis TaxID=993084 RepID=UPI0031DCBB58
MDEREDHRQIVSLCEHVQTEWLRARAESLGGRVWSDGPLTWVDGPDGLILVFPETIDPSALERSIEQARNEERELVGAWVDNEMDASALAAAGFERGWAPWWLAADLAGIDAPADPRVHVGVDLEDVRDEQGHNGYDRMLGLARAQPERAFYAGIRIDGVLAGHAWSFVDGDVAGIFDLDVWPPFRRRGFGAALLHAVAAAAHGAGARTAVVGTSPQDAIIYRAQGFNRVGMSSTWWRHL